MYNLKQNDVFASRYKLLEKLGVGGFSEVWKVVDQKAGNIEVALKIFGYRKRRMKIIAGLQEISLQNKVWFCAGGFVLRKSCLSPDTISCRDEFFFGKENQTADFAEIY